MVLQLLNLADGFSAYVSGQAEAQFIYKEIFEDHSYDGTDLSETPTIIDAGANIGLFSIYMKKMYPGSKIIAFEPSPETFDALRRNLAMHEASGVMTYPCGLGSKSSMLTLTYYPMAHGNSTFLPGEKELQKKVMTETHGQKYIDELFGAAYDIPVPVNRLSHFLHAYHPDLTTIDLLKIDVEGMELEVLYGTDDSHWDMVHNIVMEVGNGNGALSKTKNFLESKGFDVIVEAADWAPEQLEMYMVKGHRAGTILAK